MFGRKRPISDFSEELHAHLSIEIDRLRAEGLNEEEARRQARRNVGNAFGSRERFYESARWLWADHLWQDARYALRRLRKSPAFTATAVLTLALGIGGTTAIFTLVHAIMIQSLPVANPAQLYRLGKKTHCCHWGGYTQQGEFSIVSYELYRHLRDNTPGFEELAAFSGGIYGLSVRRAGSPNTAISLLGKFVSGNYFSTFDIGAFAGRMLAPSDDRPGAPPAAVMSYAIWRDKFGLDPSVAGAVFNLNSTPFTIVGVAPPGFFGETLDSNPPDFWIPLSAEPVLEDPNSVLNEPVTSWLEAIGRIRPVVSPAAVQAQMRIALHQWLLGHVSGMTASERADLPRQTLYVTPGGAGITSLRDAYADSLNLLMILSGAVLLVVCANLANLMLARGIDRKQQIALSIALGAPTSRLTSQALVESILLAVAGGIAGTALSYAGVHAILQIAFPGPRPSAIAATPSFPVLFFALGVSVLTGIVFGIAPAWAASHSDAAEALRGANHSTRDTGSLPRRALVILQAALSLALLCSAGLLTQSLRHLRNQGYGFAKENHWIVRFDPQLARYKPEQLDSLYRRVHDRLMRIPGVLGASMSIYAPMTGNIWNDNVFLPGEPLPGPRDDISSAWDRVTPGYFETIGTRILRGRPITAQDTARSPHVAVVNEAFARRFFPGEDPIGKHFGKIWPENSGELEIAGVAADAQYWASALRDPAPPMFFVAQDQPSRYKNLGIASSEVESRYFEIAEVHTAGPIQGFDMQVRRAFAAVDPNLTVPSVESVSRLVSENFTQQDLLARACSWFGLLALILAAVGVYGVTAYSVGRRTAEIGIRVALGASRGSVLALVLRGAILLVTIGLALGIPFTYGMGRVLANQLYGIGSFDPLVLSGSIGVLALCAFVAALIPARRAASISLIEALRAD